MPFITQGKINLKYILIVIVLAVIVGGGILGYQYWWGPSPSISTTQLSPTIELKYRLQEEFGKATFCEPHPMRSDYENELLKQFPAIAENTEEYQSILKHTNLSDTSFLSDEEKLLVVWEHNRLSAISLEKLNGKYKFELRSKLDNRKEFIFEGFITESGSIEITKKEAYPWGCPICLAKNTFIDTPFGEVAIQDLQKGVTVWTTNVSGARVSAIILEIVRTPVSTGHQMVNLVLDDGRELFVSPGHPTGDGRTIGDLSLGEIVDGARVIITKHITYSETTTYDILPSGETGTYWANSILIGSTITSPFSGCK